MSRSLTSHQRILVAAADQVLASTAWYVPVLFVARGASPADFGIFLIAFGLIATAVAVSRAMFGVVVGMDAASLGPGASLDRTLRHSAAGAIGCGVLTAMTLLVAATILPRSSVLIALLALGASVVLPQDLARYTAVAMAAPGRALLIDAVWSLPCLLGLALDALGIIAISPQAGLCLWVAAGASSLIAAALAGLVAHPQFRRLRGWWREDRRRWHLGGESILSGAVPVVNGWGAALVGGGVAVAAVRGAAMLFAPVTMLMLVLTMTAVPEAHRRSRHGAQRLLIALTALLAAAALTWSVLALLLPDSLGRELLGDSWSHVRPVLPWVCLEYIGVALWAGGAAMLRYSSATPRVLGLRLGYAPAAVVLPPVALLAMQADPRAFAAVLALLAWLVGPLSVWMGLSAMRAIPQRTRDRQVEAS